MSTFSYWTRDLLRERFGLKRIYDHDILLEWLEKSVEIDDYEKTTLMRWRKTLLKYVDYWNEEEVKLKFIGNIISLIDYDTDSISAFADRYLEGVVDGETLSGKPDFVVAKGKQEIKAPFFFLHEYKKELNNDSPDPAGQCLAAMLVAYQYNLQVPELKEKPIYGAYVIGRNWFFMILEGRNYAISDAYVATHTDDLLDIYRIMKASRNRIREIYE
jgi:hypothetical protein